jgi:hypothetical protein
MDLDGGGYTLDMQAKRVVDNVLNYRGSHPCPQCGLIMDPVAVMYSKGLCADCFSQVKAKRLKNRMA